MENTIRWRDGWNKQGDMIKESNARMVRWSDGSMSLHLGSEIFDVYKQPLQVRSHKASRNRLYERILEDSSFSLNEVPPFAPLKLVAKFYLHFFLVIFTHCNVFIDAEHDGEVGIDVSSFAFKCQEIYC